jgi:AcrR family transcriptional regulator
MNIPAPPWQRTAKPKPAKRQLTREAVVDAALRVLDKEGLDAVTMRRVAQELETGPASLYVHVTNKNELHQLLVDRVTAEIPLPDPDPARWEEQIRQLIRDSVRVYAAHPGVAQIAMSGLPTGPNSLRVMESTLSLLRAGGLSDQVVAWAGDLLGLFVPATALEESLFRAAGQTEETMKEFVAQYGDYLKSLPVEQFPTTIALADHLVAGAGEERFDFKMDVLLAGLIATSRARR